MNIPPPRRWLPVVLVVAVAAWVQSPALGLAAALGAPLLWLTPRRWRLPAAGIIAALWVGGRAAAWHTLAPPAPVLPLVGEVVAVTLKGDADWIDVAPDGARAWRVRVRVLSRQPALTPGARVRLSGRLERPPPADNPGGFDPAAFAARSEVRWRLWGQLVLLEPGPVDPALSARAAARARLQRADPAFGAGVLRGVLLGDRAAVPEPALIALEATGTAHLLAVSGLHVGGLAWVVYALAGFVARRAHRVHPARWAASAALPAALGYAALAQWPTSATRAATMVGLFLVGRALGRPTDVPNLLAFAAVSALLLFPDALFEPGFQLSFGAVAALVWSRPGGGLLGTARVALVAALATAPIQAAHFGTAAPLSPLANLVITPVASLVLVPVSLLGLAVEPWWPGLLGFAAEAAGGLVALSEAIADYGGGVWIVGTHWAPVLAVPAIVAVTWRRARPLGLALALGAALSPLARPDGPTVDFVAVGQGDAILVRDGAHALLVDAGPDLEARELLGVLRRAGVARLEEISISHGHPDHFGGTQAVVEAIAVGRVRYNGRPIDGPDWRALLVAAAARGVPVEVAQDDQLEWPRLQITTRTPPPNAVLENDASLVVRVRSATASVLLTGDLEHAGEAALVTERPAPVTVLKAGHHGSRTSTSADLLALLRPGWVVASCGRHNRYGFPHPEVRARLAEAAVPLWQTDRDGAVHLDLGERPWIEAMWRSGEPLGESLEDGDE